MYVYRHVQSTTIHARFEVCVALLCIRLEYTISVGIIIMSQMLNLSYVSLIIHIRLIYHNIYLCLTHTLLVTIIHLDLYSKTLLKLVRLNNYWSKSGEARMQRDVSHAQLFLKEV